jgi:hypothetical protein
MKPRTAYQRAISNAKRCAPKVRQIENSLFFDVESTSKPGTFHHVYLGPNKFNPLLEASCECTDRRYFTCVHRAAAFLQFTSNIETRLWAGGEYIVNLEDNSGDENRLEEANKLYSDLLDRFERCCDLLNAIELGWNISELKQPFKHLLPTSEGNQPQQLLTA